MSVETDWQTPPEAHESGSDREAGRDPDRAVPDFSRESVIADYRLAYRSREASLLGRREALTGKAKFGIFGDGKEVAQVAMARAFRRGDFRSGYYRDQTFMFAIGELTVREFFAQLYADPDPEHDRASAGRQMNAHFATRFLEPDGSLRDLTRCFNVTADVSPTGSQMPRLVGLAYASKLFRELPELRELSHLSHNGDEIAWGTIGNASCAEGMLWEAINAVGVLECPMLLSIWDDEYGISVPNIHQITKSDLSQLLWGFQRSRDDREGYDLYRVKGWDYPALVETYLQAAEIVRRSHVPAIVHVVEMTQPQGHSTSGSHERYKDQERLDWEEEHDCVRRMRRWMVEQGIAETDELDDMEREDKDWVREQQRAAWDAYREPIDEARNLVVSITRELAQAVGGDGSGAELRGELEGLAKGLQRKQAAFRRDVLATARDVLLAVREQPLDDETPRDRLRRWAEDERRAGRERYGSHLVSETGSSALEVTPVPPTYDDDAETLNGFEILNRFFDQALARDPRLIAFGEDVGQLGDVNQGFLGLQDKHGELRVSDTGIRECTILGQAIGMAMRGLRPLAEVQYLDYILYALQILSDDLACVRWRSHGQQMAPVIVRTRGHRLEGVWHAGSPMAGILHLVRGMHVCVPRDMTRAAGFYNTLLASDDPGLVVEVLNGYRIKERLPSNLAEMTIPLGVPEVLREGSDVTLVTYGAMCRIALEAAEQLARAGIEVEVLDVQTLLPFDRHGRILESLKKTSRIVFADEDVPGGTTGYMLQQVLEEQGGYRWLDSEPKTVSSQPHRPAYGSDGDYFSKPNREDLFDTVYELMHECRPAEFPVFWR